MGLLSYLCVILGLFLLNDVAVISALSSKQVYIWPLPKYVKNGGETLYMNTDFQLRIPSGSKYGDGSGILKDGFARMVALLHQDHVLDPSYNSSHQSNLLSGIDVAIYSSNDELQYGVDESYNLSVPSPGKSVYARIEAGTVYGALHGLETFSQLCQFNFKTRAIEVSLAPWIITDQPRFAYRGLLIDTSRHYLPLPVIKKVIDSMTYAKLNVLHWHIVDTQSFPLEIPSYPKLRYGAYSVSEQYTFADAAEIRRGVNVLAEIDVPGHASSWGVGYPALWPSKDCKEPLDVSNEFTFKLIDGILSDFSKIFKFKFVHLGGDEVNTSCWETTPHVNSWLNKNKMSSSEAYEYFVLRAQKIALCIVSNQDKWYLDHLDATWDQFYSNEPLRDIHGSDKQNLVLGGEVCMWGEHIDGSDIEQTIWPRAAAAAERLWTSYDKLAKDPFEVIGRLAHFRCLLNLRGIAAAPLHGAGRVAPLDPGSCYKQ
ncbi:hypothetical protein V2J09_007723 [Rumex salicifolius]